MALKYFHKYISFGKVIVRTDHKKTKTFLRMLTRIARYLECSQFMKGMI